MANVAVYNMQGEQVDTIELNDAVFGVEVNEHLVHVRELRRPRPDPKYPEAEESPGDRREPVMQDRDPSELLSGRAAE